MTPPSTLFLFIDHVFIYDAWEATQNRGKKWIQTEEMTSKFGIVPYFLSPSVRAMFEAG